MKTVNKTATRITVQIVERLRGASLKVKNSKTFTVYEAKFAEVVAALEKALNGK